MEGIAFQTMDVVHAMENRITELKVDGGASRNNLMMQFQADLLGTSVIRPQTTETTAIGAAFLAGLATGYWESIERIGKLWHSERIFIPGDCSTDIEAMKRHWAEAVGRTLRRT